LDDLIASAQKIRALSGASRLIIRKENRDTIH
jgi:hypothetical protein